MSLIPHPHLQPLTPTPSFPLLVACAHLLTVSYVAPFPPVPSRVGCFDLFREHAMDPGPWNPRFKKKERVCHGQINGANFEEESPLSGNYSSYQLLDNLRGPGWLTLLSLAISKLLKPQNLFSPSNNICYSTGPVLQGTDFGKYRRALI